MLTLEERPFSFDQMIGQKGILKEMEKRSKTMDFPPVMIFEGASGTGKTTLAYIIAALLCDPNPIVNKDGSKSPNPESPICKAVRANRFNADIIFKDASSMGKDDVNQLAESLSIAPMFGDKKVLIIDEAQELGKLAKGATLTLLEKRRVDTYIILCTMNIDAFDKAVKSRGALYKFKSPTSEEIAEYLMTLTDKFNIPCDDAHMEFFQKGLFTIADSCDGSVRMAVQNFERAVLGEFFTVAEIEREFGVISNEKMASLMNRLAAQDKEVIADIRSFGSKDFFYKMFRILTEAYLYQKTQYVDQSWKARTYEPFMKYDLGKILNTFLRVDANGYFKEDVFTISLVEAFYDNQVSTPTAPVKRVRVPIEG